MKEKFAQWNVLFVQYLKRDWKLILVWILGLGAFCGGFVPAMEAVSKGDALRGLYETMKNPAMIAMVGTTPITDAAAYTVGAMYSHMMLLFCGIFAMIVSVMHVISHARKEEERGLTEFICTYRIGRHANALALMAEELLVHLLLALFTAGLMISFRVESMEAMSCLVFGFSIGLAGMIGAVIALLMSQIMATSAGATASSLGIVGMLYMIRGGMDLSGSEVHWWNPMEWTYKAYPFSENNWKVLLPGIVFCVAIIALSFVLEAGRDMGAGYLPELGNRKKVKKSLLSVPGFLLHLNFGTMLAWVLTLGIFGAMYGSIYGDMQSFLEGNDLLKAMFQMQGISIETSFTMTILVILAGLAFIVPVSVMNRMYGEESAGRMGQIYATKTGRGSIYWTSAVIAACVGALALLAAAAGLGGAAVTVTTGSEMELADFIKAGMNFFPASLFMIAMAGLLAGWAPKWGKALYGYTAYCMILNYFLKLLEVPEWVEKTAILSWIPRMPVDPFDGAVFFGITGVSIGILILGYLGYLRRDLQESV